MKFKIRMTLGQFIMIMGVTGLTLVLINESISLVAKSILFIVSMGVIVLGILLDTPWLEHWKTQPEGFAKPE